MMKGIIELSKEILKASRELDHGEGPEFAAAPQQALLASCRSLEDLVSGEGVKLFVWVSRHPLSNEQRDNLSFHGYFPVDYGDADAFGREDTAALQSALRTLHRTVGRLPTVGCVHPQLQKALDCWGYPTLTSSSSNRAPDGERPDFRFSHWSTIDPDGLPASI